MVDSTPEVGSSSAAGPEASSRPRRAWGLWIAAGCLVGAAVAQLLGGSVVDHQFANIATGVFLLGAVGCALLWWVRFGAPNRTAAAVPVTVLVLAVVVLAMLFRYTGVSGDLVPQFRWRFASGPPLPVPDADQEAVTLRVDDQAYPGFLGPTRRAVVPRREFGIRGLEDVEPEWREPVGAGWSGFAIAGDHAVTIEQRDQEEWVTCYAVDDGRLVWYHASPERHEHALGGVGPRSTPTIAGGRVYAQGATGKLWCLDGADGSRVWSVDLLELAGISPEEAEEAVRWGRAASPLLVDGLVVVPLGGPEGAAKSLVALDAETGQTVWTGGDRQISYASPVLATVAGVRQILSVNEDNVSGHDPATGEVLWEYPWPGSSNTGANVSQPMPVGEDRVLISKGYGGGGMLLRLGRDSDGRLVAEPVWQSRRVLKTKFTNAAIRDGFAYALSDGWLECVDLSDGTRQWQQPRRGRYVQGQVLRVEDVLVVQAESGEVAFVRATPERFDELARLDALEGKTWNYPAISGRRLLVRNARQAALLRLPPRDRTEEP